MCVTEFKNDDWVMNDEFKMVIGVLKKVELRPAQVSSVFNVAALYKTIMARGGHR